MEEKVKPIEAVVNAKYLRIVPRIDYYLKSKNIPDILKHKCLLFAVGGAEGRIYLFTNSLEQMDSLFGHKSWIWCLFTFSSKLLASGSEDNTIKIWDIEKRITISTLSKHTNTVTALCCVREGIFVSGSADKSLIIWYKSTPQGSTPTPYTHSYILTGHKSYIRGIIRITNIEILSGEDDGDLRIWNIDQGLCVRHISNMGNLYLTQMKQNIGGEVALSHWGMINVFGTANNWEIPLKEFSVCKGISIEFLSRDLLLSGGDKGGLKFIDYGETGCELPSIIQQLHSNIICALQCIAKNIIVTASMDRYLKVIDPISRKCYMRFKKGEGWMQAIAYFY